jgi:predicted nucleic acid-binding protein
MIFVDTGALIALEDVNDKNRIQRMRQGGILEIIHISK